MYVVEYLLNPSICGPLAAGETTRTLFSCAKIRKKIVTVATYCSFFSYCFQ